MRLQRIEVSGFGSLRDVAVDFHPRITVILGDNESGKSTLQRAVRAALYGLDAGRQGKPVERSDWWRWRPWVAGPYGVALTYGLGDGRVVRVARGFETRDHTVQVLELGGSDLTDELRRGRQVVPGLCHLGVDEAVFCATAWLGDDGLRLDSPDAAAQRREPVQEAVERLADSRRGVTASAALVRLRDALHQVGTDRRPTSPLGVATIRVRDLERRRREVAQRLQLLAMERERLRDFEAETELAAAQRRRAEATWLTARLHAVEDRIAEAEAALAEHAAWEAVVAETAPRARFPLELEGRVTALAGELREAALAAGEAAARADAASEPLAAARNRLADVDAALAVVSRSPELDSSLGDSVASAGVELARVRQLAAEARTVGSGEARVGALRREIAATGLAAMPLGSADALAALVRASRGRAAVAAWVLGAAGSAAAAITALSMGVRLQRTGIGAAAGVVLLLGAIALAAGAWRRQRRATSAASEIAALEARLGISAGDLQQVRDRVPALQALHAALRREEAALAGRRAELDAVAAAATALHQRCERLAAAAGVTAAPATGVIPEAALERCAELLDRVGGALALQQRRRELTVEQRHLRAEIAAHEALVEEADRCRENAARIERALRMQLDDAGVDTAISPQQAVAAVREACEERRRHDEARHALAVVAQRFAALGDRGALELAASRLRQELEGRDAPPDGAGPRLDDAGLHELELEVRRATQAQHAAEAASRELRARLEGLLETVPDLADLEDELQTWEAARQRCLRQHAALTRAITLLEGAARTSHRDLAPVLAESVATHLGALTDSRYRAVNVDTDHFAVALLCRDRPEMVPLEHVSHGTRDQVALLLRLALCTALSGGEPAPLLLDEPLLTADPGRRAGMILFLQELSATHQAIITTADPDVAASVRAECGELCDVVHLHSPAAVRRSQQAVRVAG